MSSDILKEKLNLLPNSPGVYEFLDSSHRVIYVGKSVNLRSRVRSYFTNNPKWHKAKSMQAFIMDIRITQTDTDLDARYLECKKIHRLQPIYNSQMKRSNRELFLTFCSKNEVIAIEYEEGHNNIGPLNNIHRLKNFLGDLSCLYPLERVKDKFVFSYSPIPKRLNPEEKNRTGKRVEEIFRNEKDYQEFIRILYNQMLEESRQIHFERAAYYRDLIQSFEYYHKQILRFTVFLKNRYLYEFPFGENSKRYFIEEGLIKETWIEDNAHKKRVWKEEERLERELKLKLHTVLFHFIENQKSNELSIIEER